jgi:hypothetical protein
LVSRTTSALGASAVAVVLGSGGAVSVAVTVGVSVAWLVDVTVEAMVITAVVVGGSA